MSAENLETVRGCIEDHRTLTSKNARQFAARFWDPEADYYPVRKFPEARPCHGRDEIARFHADYRDAWESYELAIQELTAVGDDRVLVHGTIRAEGRESGVRLEGDIYHCVWLRHGQIFRWEDHLTVRGAIRAFGLDGETLGAAGLRV